MGSGGSFNPQDVIVDPLKKLGRKANEPVSDLFRPPEMPDIPAPEPPPAPPTTEERATGITEASTAARLKRRTRAGRRGTILTSPLGLQEEIVTAQKTLLGE
jgi:hypothetical protein